MTLQTFWFILIAVLWIGYLFLEGFDLGVGMHMRILARDEKERRLLLNTIGPVWDGNEVWLITAGGATFAAFPLWYASLFSALYIPLTLVLVGLIFRAVSIEYRSKGHTERWLRLWTWGMALGSFVAAFGIGALLGLTTTGLPLNQYGDRVGGWHAVLDRNAIIGGLAVVGIQFGAWRDVHHAQNRWRDAPAFARVRAAVDADSPAPARGLGRDRAARQRHPLDLGAGGHRGGRGGLRLDQHARRKRNARFRRHSGFPTGRRDFDLRCRLPGGAPLDDRFRLGSDSAMPHRPPATP